MKKNVMMRVASVLLVAVMLSTCVISGTFAKYVTDGSATDTARVAKWGVKVEANFDSLFTRGYALASVNSTSDEGAASVWADSEVGVVAPGTAGQLANFNITGKPEVDVRVNYSADVELTGAWSDGTAFYCPLYITISHESTTTSLTGLDYESADDFEAAIEAAVLGLTKDYNAGDLMSEINDDLQISWSWAFEEGAHGIKNDQTNVKDTFLGNWVTNYPTEAPTISVTVTATVTQID